MREIRFRAKPRDLFDKRAWVYGDFVTIKQDGHPTGFIHQPYKLFSKEEEEPYTEIIETTVGQYIGLNDKKDSEIYEGDIVRLDSSEIGGEKVAGEVVFNTDQTLANLEFGIWTNRGFYRTDFLGVIEVIGNIYDNPELLG